MHYNQMNEITPLHYYKIHNKNSGSTSQQVGLITSTTTATLGGQKLVSSSSSEDGIGSSKSLKSKASQKHAFAEQKRRERINRHYNTLRNFLPYLHKRDKASVLTETVRRIKELRKKVAEECGDCKSAWPCYIPSDYDEATVSSYNDHHESTTTEGKMVKATVCCEARPGLNRDLAEALKVVRGKAVKAEMVTIGGRIKVVVVVQWSEGGGEESVGSLRRALKAVVENRAFIQNGLLAHSLPCSKWAVLGHIDP